MAKYAAFGTLLKMGTAQVETATAVGTISSPGNMTAIVTASGMTGSPITLTVAVLLNDTPDMWAEKVRAAALLNANITALFHVEGSGPYIVLRKKVATANDPTLNIALADSTSAGITEDATSDDTTAGVVLTTVAQVTNISGPGLALDTEDVTTHDSTGGWEEVTGTILRSGEVSLDIVYDPGGATHDNTTGLLAALSSRALRDFSVTFPSSPAVVWYFDGYVTGFEPDAPVDGALTASVTVKITGQPVIA